MIEKFTTQNLQKFRMDNGLLQQDIAMFLECTRGYISIVENGGSRLARPNLDKIFNAAESNGWNTYALVPAYSRLRDVIEYMKHQNQSQGRGVFPVPQNIFDKVKYGEMEIPEHVADGIIKIYPEINRQWLLSGFGEMCLTKEDGIDKDSDPVLVRLSRIEASLNKIMEMLEKKR